LNFWKEKERHISKYAALFLLLFYEPSCTPPSHFGFFAVPSKRELVLNFSNFPVIAADFVLFNSAVISLLVSGLKFF